MQRTLTGASDTKPAVQHLLWLNQAAHLAHIAQGFRVVARNHVWMRPEHPGWYAEESTKVLWLVFCTLFSERENTSHVTHPFLAPACAPVAHVTSVCPLDYNHRRLRHHRCSCAALAAAFS